jgi:hypothetical protein
MKPLEKDQDKALTEQLSVIGREEIILRYFTFAHLPSGLAAVSKRFAELALEIVSLPKSAERTVALRKLLESKDSAVRAALPPIS